MLFLHDKNPYFFYDQVVNNILGVGHGEYDDYEDTIRASLKSIEKKMAKMSKIGLSITKKTAWIMQNFSNRLALGVMHNKIDRETTEMFQEIILPFDILTISNLYAIKPIEQVEFDNLLFNLRNEIIKENPYLKIKA